MAEKLEDKAEEHLKEAKKAIAELLHDLVVYLRLHTKGLSRRTIAILLLFAFEELTKEATVRR